MLSSISNFDIAINSKICSSMKVKKVWDGTFLRKNSWNQELFPLTLEEGKISVFQTEIWPVLPL